MKLDGDFATGDWRAMQMTPPGSPCSIIFGKGMTTAAPGSMQGNFLVVDDIDGGARRVGSKRASTSARSSISKGGLQVYRTKGARRPGSAEPEVSYSSWASFSDPDGNSWMLQEITTRLPGRGLEQGRPGGDRNVEGGGEQCTASTRPKAPKHHWSDWYAAYIVARQNGSTPEAAAEAAGRHMATILQ